jgi:hypothetical protein
MGKKEESEAVALRSGLLQGTLAAAGIAGFHLAFQRASWYASIPAAPKRIVGALVVLGTFSYAAHVSQAQHVLETNREVAERAARR